MRLIAKFALTLTLTTLLATQAVAQQGNAPVTPPAKDGVGFPPLKLPQGGFGIGDQFGGGLNGGGGSSRVFFAGALAVEEGTRNGRLSVTADVLEGWHIYSLTQQSPLQPSRIFVESPQVFEQVGNFVADADPKIKTVDYYKVPLEEHYGKVIFTAPVVLAEGVDPATAKFVVKFDGQVCSETTCIGIEREDVPTRFSGYSVAAKAAMDGYQADNSHARMEVWLEPRQVVPGGTAKLTIKANLEDHYHIYKLEKSDPKSFSKPTLVVLSKRNSFTASFPTTSSSVIEEEVLPGEPPVQYYENDVVWTVDLQVPADMSTGEFQLVGLLGYQTCDEDSCDSPTGAKFTVPFVVGDQEQAGKALAIFEAAEYDQASTNSQLGTWYEQPAPALTTAALIQFIGFGLLGGLILNLMPCVLPVIGLKIMSFAEQAGHSYGRVLSLNLWFSAGLIFVFMILATLAAFMSLGWGQQFTDLRFKVAMICLVFAMALSFLGVWEIPIPGFVGAGKANDLQAKEGIAGAFFKGIFTTILATPCSGPFLGPVFALTLKQPPSVIYVMFASVGVGMASPYILVGLFPHLVRWIPKPGAWMETFKQLMGFVLLATVVYLFASVPENYVETLALLIAVWFGCWLIGRMPITVSGAVKARTWAIAIAVPVLVTMVGFRYLADKSDLLPWEPYSPVVLKELQGEGKTVMVDYTAEWCLTCKYNLATAINTEEVKQLVEQNGVVPMLADWTSKNDVIKKSLAELNANSIPLVAIYPSSDPDEVIILRDLITQSQLLEALKKAGPSKASDAAAQQTSVTASRSLAAPLPVNR